MCARVTVLGPKGEDIDYEVDTPAKLRQYLLVIVPSRHYDEDGIDEDCCLCQVDIEASTKASGLAYENWDGITHVVRQAGG